MVLRVLRRRTRTHRGVIGALRAGERALAAGRPDFALVHLERATNPSPPERAKKIDSLRRGRAAYPFLKDIREIAPTGWYGDPRKATPEKAREFLEKVAAASADYIRNTFRELGEDG